MRAENRFAIGVAVVSSMLGVLALVVLGGIVQIVAASVLLGITGVALVSLVFLLVGQSEERDRQQHPGG